MNPKDFRTKCLAASVLALFVWFQPCEGFLDDGRSRNDVRGSYWETNTSPKWCQVPLEKNRIPFDDAACDTRKTLLPLVNPAKGFKRTTQEQCEGNLNRNKDFSSNFDKGRNYRSRQGTSNPITTERRRSMNSNPKHTSSSDVRNLQLNENEKLARQVPKPTPRLHQTRTRRSNEIRNSMKTDDQNRNTKTMTGIRNGLVRNPIQYRNQRGAVEDGNIREVSKESRNVQNEVKRNGLELKHESVVESKARKYRNSHEIESTPIQHRNRNVRFENKIIKRSASRNDENERRDISKIAERKIESRKLNREGQRNVRQQNIATNFNLDERLRRSDTRRSTREESMDVKQRAQIRILYDAGINENREIRLSTRSDLNKINTRSITRRVNDRSSSNEIRKSNTEARKENTDVRREGGFRGTRNGEELKTNHRNGPNFERASPKVSGVLHRSTRTMSDVRQTKRVKNEMVSTARDGRVQESHSIRYVIANNGKSERRTAEDVVVTLHDVGSKEVKYRRNSEGSSNRIVVKTNEDRRRIRNERETDTNPERIQQDKQKREVNQRTRSSLETHGKHAHHRNHAKSRIEEVRDENGFRSRRDASRSRESEIRTNLAGRDVNNNIVRDDRQRWSRNLERTSSRIPKSEPVRRQLGRTVEDVSRREDIVGDTSPRMSNNVRDRIQASTVVQVGRMDRSASNNIRGRTQVSRVVENISGGGNRREMTGPTTFSNKRESQVVDRTLTGGNSNQRLTRTTNMQGVQSERLESRVHFRTVPENNLVDRTRDIHRRQFRATTSRGTISREINALNRKDTDRARILGLSDRKIQERTREHSQIERIERRSTVGDFETRYISLVDASNGLKSHRYQNSEEDRNNGRESSRNSLGRVRGNTSDVQSRKQSRDRDVSGIERTRRISVTRSARNEHISSIVTTNDKRTRFEADTYRNLDENRRWGKQDQRTGAGKQLGDVQTQRRALGLGVREGIKTERTLEEKYARQGVTTRRLEENPNTRSTSRRFLQEQAEGGARNDRRHYQGMGTKTLELYGEVAQVFNDKRNGWVNFFKTLLTSLVLMQVVAKANVKQYSFGSVASYVRGIKEMVF